MSLLETGQFYIDHGIARGDTVIFPGEPPVEGIVTKVPSDTPDLHPSGYPFAEVVHIEVAGEATRIINACEALARFSLVSALIPDPRPNIS